jgi:hypothetical protein
MENDDLLQLWNAAVKKRGSFERIRAEWRQFLDFSDSDSSSEPPESPQPVAVKRAATMIQRWWRSLTFDEPTLQDHIDYEEYKQAMCHGCGYGHDLHSCTIARRNY